MDIRLMTLKDYDRVSALWQNTPGMGHSPQDDTREGIGSVLLNHAMAALAAEGITKAALLVFATNENGNAFWQKQGFEARPDVVYRNRNIEPPLAVGDVTLH